MQAMVFKCDNCNSERKEANHWFVARAQDDSSSSFAAFSLWPFNETTAVYKGAKHLCGEACLNAEQSAWIERNRVRSDVAIKRD